MSTSTLSVGGKKRGRFKQSDPLETIDSTYSTMSVNVLEETTQNTLKKKKLSTPESVQLTRKRTWSDRSNLSKDPIPTTKSSKTLAQGSTGRGKALFPFWTEYSKEISERLLLHTRTDSADLLTNCLSTSSKDLGQKSWFTATVKKQQIHKENCQKTCCPSSQSLWQKIMECEVQKIGKEECKNKKECRKPQKKKQKLDQLPREEKQPAAKAIKIRIYPNNTQKQILQKWFGTARWTYNQCLTTTLTNRSFINKKSLRQQHLNKESFLNRPNERWVLETPYDIRDEAMNDLLKAYKTCFSVGKKFNIKFRSKKNTTQCIAVLAKHWNRTRGEYSLIFSPQNMKSSEPLPEVLVYDSRLIMDSLGRYFICMPKPLDIKSDNQAPENLHCLSGVLAIDPGVRTFATCYDPIDMVFEWGACNISRIEKLCCVLDHLQSRWCSTEIRSRKRYRMKRAAKRLRIRIRNLVDELHKKLSLWIVKNYRVVLLPKYPVSEMVSRARRSIRSKTVRNMLTWSYYRFKMRLINKSREHPWCKIIEVTEEFTSQTCGKCGNLTKTSNKIYKCKHCNLTTDRDLNGARNILIKYITDNRINLSENN